MLPLSKSLAPEDLTDLALEITTLEEYGDRLGEQASGYRLWEWAMALRAWQQWAGITRKLDMPGGVVQLLDIGGAGSPLSWILNDGARVQCTILDPKINFAIEAAAHLPDGSIHAAFATSVLEHVTKPTGFLRACHRVLAPGGLLFLTMDGWNCEGVDTAHFHWDRVRIYNPASWKALRDLCTQELGFKQFGGVDWAFHGNHVYNYSFLSLALVKEP